MDKLLIIAVALALLAIGHRLMIKERKIDRHFIQRTRHAHTQRAFGIIILLAGVLGLIVAAHV